MKPVPPNIVANGPPGTEWFGGTVDCSTMALRVGAKVRGESVDKSEISQLLGCESDQEKFRHWSIGAPDKEEANLDSQVSWILERPTRDLTVWRTLTAQYRVDLFCGLFLDRPNRGVSLSPKTMFELGARGIEIGFDIYAPESEKPNKTPEPTATAALDRAI